MNDLDKAIYTQLTTTAAVTGYVGSRSYNLQAPQEATEPYVIFSKMSGTSDYLFGSTKGRSYAYLVKGVAKSRYPKAAGDIDDAIENAMENAALAVSGWTTIYCRREMDVSFAEEEYTHRGGVYRIVLQQ
jgi:hypothetical protein